MIARVQAFPGEWLPWGIRAGREDAPFGSDGCSLSDLLGYADRLARLPDARSLCVMTDDRVDVAAALLSALGGGPRVLLPHAVGAEALRQVVAHRAPSHFIGPPEWQRLVPASRVDVSRGRSGGGRAVFRPSSSEEPILWLFTGGSTGRQKLWPKSARSLLSESAMLVRNFGLGPEHRIAATVPPFHIYGLLFSVIAPLLSGAPVDRLAASFPREIVARMNATEATILVSTPAHLRALSQVPWSCPSLRIVFSSGAPLSRADACAFHERAGVWPLEIYGSTETGGVAVRTQREAQEPWSPLPGVSTRIVEEHIEVRSEHLDDRLPRGPDRFFRTGDRGEALEDGRFRLLGRADGIAKVAGERVDLTEVEEKLRSLGGVREAFVFARAIDSMRGQEVIAIVAAERTEGELLTDLRALLAPASCPRTLVCVERIPVTAAGKWDRSAIDRLLRERRR